MKLLTETGELIVIAEKHFASGAEGLVYNIVAPKSKFEKFCVKIYNYSNSKTEKNDSVFNKTVTRRNKIKYLVANPPPTIELFESFIIAWPIEAVYNFDDDSFAGFIMRKAFSDSEPLFQLTNLKIASDLPSPWHIRYSFLETNSLSNRLKLCLNVASVLAIVRDAKNYVQVDFKPQNILVTFDGKVTLIDMDSVQVKEKGKLLFPSSISTLGYYPPEYSRISDSETREHTWENFQYAIVFYELLLGIHPFTAVGLNSYSEANTPQEKIDAGLFPFGTYATRIAVTPPAQKRFNELPKQLQTCFIRTFSSGFDNPHDRTGILEWKGALLNSLQENNESSPPEELLRKSASTETISQENTIPKNGNRKKIIILIVLVIMSLVALYFLQSNTN